jgi:hypothetical protein
MKQCPYCMEEIQEASIACQYCGRDLQDPKPAEPSAWKLSAAAALENTRHGQVAQWLKDLFS